MKSQKCIICGSENAPYNYPCCGQPFCSVKCSKIEHDHPEQENPPAPETPPDEQEALLLGMFKPEVMKLMSENSELKSIISDPSVMESIKAIATAQQPKPALKEQLHINPNFSSAAQKIYEICSEIDQVKSHIQTNRTATTTSAATTATTRAPNNNH